MKLLIKKMCLVYLICSFIFCGCSYCDEKKEKELVLQLESADAEKTENARDEALIKETDLESFDTSTVTGAMEYIICYAKETWNCDVVFYTGSRYDSAAYEAMVIRVKELEEKWGIGVLDLWTGEEFNAITDEQRAFYMNDSIHPTKAGYRDWWCPEMELQLLEFLAE